MERFIAEVRNLKDPWESGRVQIRVYGKHDDEENIKDEHLPWAMVLLPITSASTNRIGISPTGLLVGSRVMGYYLDEAHQYPVIIGSFPRAGKQKDDQDNTKGFDDIDEKHSDVPLAAIGSPQRQKTTAFKNPLSQSSDQKKRPAQANNGYEKDPKYNKVKEAEQKGDDALKNSREQSIKTADKGTVASVGKDQNQQSILEKILKVDGSNDAGALPMAPQMFQQIIQISNMTGMGGINGMASGAMGGALGGIAGNIGIGNVLGSLSGMLGVDLSMLSGMTGMLGGMMGGSGGGGNGSGPGGAPGGASGAYYANQVPTTPNDVAVTAAELLNQLGGYKTPTNEIAGMSVEDKEALYRALIDLMNNVGADLNVNTSITVSESSLDKMVFVQAPPQTNLEIIVSQTDTETVSQITLPGSYVASVDLIPDAYIPVYYFTDVDPYPGYMEWEGPEGQRVFCPRPEDRPYVATPTEDCINASIITIINELLALIKSGKLTLAKQSELLQTARDTAQNQGNQNTHGKNNSGASAIQALLGMLGQLMGMMQNQQLMESVLDQGKVQKTMEDYQKKNADLRKKKALAKQAVQRKNDSQGLMNNNMLNFGNMSGKGNGGGGGVPGGSTTGGTGGSTSNVVTYITKTGNTVSQISTLPANNMANAVTFGYYTIYKS